ncbi:hypothetical protein GLAREA_00056 [Glarea lozoyensis ATCC 20868]|uniref:Peroxin 20 n=1 Tax=Glarea lozoyensis (strain ATCC 20868 / MF5171) TaxID=1116229 RepID=S3DR11_GLAL2|nr:uncharacterized protein GLAREA_00056 [Glarea lozoyensis ATCC 20868]EPE28898.1 hypothetical protein GLAREA_00056 [Glarea lozoyensis ATCC 20868]
MADSMCGPSNALNTFQKHTSIDRTLQQDRLVSRQSPSNGFRSAPGPNANLIQPEFEAFQAGVPSFEQHTFSPSPQNFGHAPPNFQQAGPANWASDFQRMNVSSPPPQQVQGYIPSQQSGGAGWHQEFAQQHDQAQRNNQGPVQGMGMGSGQGYYPQASGLNIAHQQFGDLHSQLLSQLQFSPPQQAQPEAFDEAAFARAFDEAAQLETASGGTVAEATVAEATVTEDSLAKETSESELERLQRSHHKMFVEPNDKRLAESRLRQAEYARQISPPIGADAIRPQNQGEPTQQEQQEAPDDLARTAGSLLRSVQHDTSDKFQGSQFLTLMRMLRDKEVAVQGDDIVGTGSADVEGDAERAVGDAHGARPSDFLDMWDAAPLHA